MLVIDFRFSATRRLNFTYQRQFTLQGKYIGHGVDMAYEKNFYSLLQYIANQNIPELILLVMSLF
jgi:adenosine deaminase